MSKPPTIVDVARQARVSMKTVSRTLNNEPHVSERARARVLEAAKALNYRPNQFARSLASTRSWLIGLVSAPPRPAPVYIMTVQEGVLAECEASGYNLLTRTFDPADRNLAGAVRQFVANARVDGLVLTPPLADDAALARALVASGIPHIRISQAALLPGSEHVGTNEQAIAREMTEYLLSLGHTRIGFITGHPAHSGSQDRLEGFREAMTAAGLEVPKDTVAHGLFSFESGVDCARRLLASEPRPTAVFASNDYMAAGVVNAAHRLGIRIPDELSVAGFDDAPVAHQIWPGLTTIRQPVKQLGMSATRSLIARIGPGAPAAGDPAPQDESQGGLRCELVIRESTGPCRKR